MNCKSKRRYILNTIQGNPIAQFDHLTSAKTIYWLSAGWTEISFDEIYRGLRNLILEDRLIAEGGSAVSHAAVLAGKLKLEGPTAFILSGRSIGPAQLAAIVAGEPLRLGNLTVGGTHA